MRVRRGVVFVAAVLAGLAGWPADAAPQTAEEDPATLPLPAETPSGLIGADGRSFPWRDWLANNSPAAVLVWSSWAPRSDAVLEQLDALAAAVRDRGLTMVLIDVQEPIEEAREALADTSVLWVHDRHGAMLKRYRVIRVPSLVILGYDGSPVARLEATADAIRAWEGEQ